jgi:hypothetical protein
MPRRSAPGATADHVRLYGEAERLTEMFGARLRAGDESGIEEFLRRREEILARIDETGAGLAVAGDEDGDPLQHTIESAEVIRRIVALNQELVALLETRMAEVRRQLAGLGLQRQTLASYQGHTHQAAAAFVDCRS